ncbi:hypothetical protein JTE90_011229 [Oedothorax gibbosus]|uniref:Histone-lysine N-methyltransferase SETMAR n=1 Tax=Oedothorax gibbosus TaxID=931172 RepID=A0AAV6VY17_9ARAC|nr:hypothetical protein JTE90_011229 [Oedothorax gibbosus]
MPVYIEDISSGQENIKISFLNEVNSYEPPTTVSYTLNCVLTSESLAENFESISLPCHCKDDCTSDCTCSASQAYNSGKLSETYDHHFGKPIIECSDLCSCNENCRNKVAQFGIKFSLQVFQTHNRGFGVRTMEFIPKSSFVCEYAGEIIDDVEAQYRISKQAADDSNYIYVLKEHSCEDKCAHTIIDPTYVGNVGRYLNHSCSPNLISVPIRSNNMVPRICFFAKSDILPLQELSYNYGGECVSRTDSSTFCKDQQISRARKCLCLSSNCCGFLPFVFDNWLS